MLLHVDLLNYFVFLSLFSTYILNFLLYFSAEMLVETYKPNAGYFIVELPGLQLFLHVFLVLARCH